MLQTAVWPPVGEPLPSGVLPAPATRVYPLPLGRVVVLALLPLLLTLQSARAIRGGLPPSRIVNPGVAVVVLLATAVVAALVLPASRRVMVAAGPGWVARRPVPGGRARAPRTSRARRWLWGDPLHSLVATGAPHCTRSGAGCPRANHRVE